MGRTSKDSSRDKTSPVPAESKIYRKFGLELTGASGMSNRLLNFGVALGIVALTVYILIIGKGLILPFVIAVVFWYFIISLMRGYRRFQIRGIRLPYGLSMGLAVTTVGVIIWLVYLLIEGNVNQVIEATPRYQARFEELVAKAFVLLGITEENPLENLIGQIDIRNLMSQFASAVTGLASDVGLIIIYVLFLLLEHRTLERKLDALHSTADESAETDLLLDEISNDINIYLKIKTAMSLLVGVISYVIMAAVGVDFAQFWAFLIFLFNYIPTVGAILGVLFPILLISVQFDSVPLIVAVSILLIANPVIINNLLEPRLMGKSLNISSLVIILSLVLWGSIWGIIGMFLCVPIMVILNIIFSKFPQTRPIAILLSANGKID